MMLRSLGMIAHPLPSLTLMFTAMFYFHGQLRESAERKRNSIMVLERVLATYEREQERINKLLENKKQDLGILHIE